MTGLHILIRMLLLSPLIYLFILYIPAIANNATYQNLWISLGINGSLEKKNTTVLPFFKNLRFCILMAH